MPDTAISADRRAFLASRRLHFGRAIVAATADPNTLDHPEMQGVDFSEFAEVVWDVIVTGTCDFRWRTWRYIEAAEAWIAQDELSVVDPALTASESIEQTCDGDRVYLQLHTVGGVGAGDQFDIYVRGVNRSRGS